MDSWALRTTLIAAVILIVGVTLYGGVNLLCQMNMRSCTVSSECASSAVCMNKRCTPRMCTPIEESSHWVKTTTISAWNSMRTWLMTPRKK